jgi:membrane protease YdiL (CAAX protease family)
VFIAIAQRTLLFVDFDQQQVTGFEGLSARYEYILAFITLVIIAPIAEEVLFRGYLFGKLRKVTKTWIAILITSVLFGIVHFAWNVGIDVFALSIIMCLVTVWSKSLWPAIIIHMSKNFLAYYFLFINPIF